MSSRKILLLAIILPTLGATIYSLKYSGKTCGGINANVKENRCPALYEYLQMKDGGQKGKAIILFVDDTRSKIALGPIDPTAVYLARK